MSFVPILGEEAKRDVKKFYDISSASLGKGSYGSVIQARLRGTDIVRAVKIIEKKRVTNKDRFRLEVEIMMKLDHPYILKMYDYFEDEEKVYLVLEICKGGEMFDRIVQAKQFDEETAQKLFRQIMRAVYYCNLKGVCHRDLKPENFLFIDKEDLVVKLIDFGLSRTFGQDTEAQMSQES